MLRQRTPRSKRTARGFTLLEAVFSMALLGLIASATMGALGFVFTSQTRERQTLAAAELSNRLLLMYLDDPGSLDSQGDKIDWITGERFRWEKHRGSLSVRPAVEIESRSNAVAPLDRLHVISIRVWLSEDSGGSLAWQPGVPSATLSRIMDPFSMMLRPDSGERMRSEYGLSGLQAWFPSGQFPGRGGAGGGGRGGSSGSTGGGSRQ